VRRGVLLAAAVCALAGCGGHSAGSTAKVETAIASKQVAKLYTHSTGLLTVRAPSCVETPIAGNFDCTGKPTYVACTANAKPTVPCQSKTAPTKAWIDCFPDPSKSEPFLCQLENPPPGTEVFVTAAQKTAPKLASWKCMTTNQGGDVLGPYSVSIANSFGPVQTQVDYVTKTQASALAKAQHLSFEAHCG
jgi:hypothetical protein